MNLNLRSGKESDAGPCGEICFNAFTTISTAHGFPPDFPSPEVAVGFFNFMLSRPDVYSVVAEADGRILGSNFLWEADAVAGIGPITVDPTKQNSGAGRMLMENVLRRAEQKQFGGGASRAGGVSQSLAITLHQARF